MKIELTSGNTDSQKEDVPTLDNSILFAKLLQNVENDNKNGEKILDSSKIVDEDGNPKVVYHQTNSSVYINRETGQNWDELDWRERMEWDERDDEWFVNVLSRAANIPPRKVQKVYDKEKQAIEETFGGIWIEDTEEFAKFVSAVNTYPTDENGEGVAKTSDYLYLYYRGIGERIIPFASVYLNKGESQNVANELINAWNNGEKEKVREYIDGAYEVARDVNVQGNILDGTDKELSATRENDRLGSELSQLGRYYYTPELYNKVKRVDSGSRGKGKVAYSLITPDMDVSYLDAVERGDGRGAQCLCSYQYDSRGA